MRTRAVMAGVALCVLFAFAACGAGTPDESSDSAVEDNGNFVLEMETPTAQDAPIAELVTESELATDVIDGLNDTYALPDDITIRFAAEDVDDTGPYFDGELNEVVMPYPYLTADREIFESYGYEGDEIDSAVLSDLLFTLYHEIGHALVSNLELPITGKEEDSVDSLAAVLLVTGWEGGQDIILEAADWFAALADGRTDEYSQSDFAGEHSLNEQRYVSLLCLAYGSDPDGYADLVDADVLPEERAEGCEAEYVQAENSWNELLYPYEFDDA